jgi:hypothetical protein
LIVRELYEAHGIRTESFAQKLFLLVNKIDYIVGAIAVGGNKQQSFPQLENVSDVLALEVDLRVCLSASFVGSQVDVQDEKSGALCPYCELVDVSGRSWLSWNLLSLGNSLSIRSVRQLDNLLDSLAARELLALLLNEVAHLLSRVDVD